MQFYLFALLTKLNKRYKFFLIFEKFILLGSFKDFHFILPHPQSSKTGSLWLIKDYTDEDLSKSLAISS